MLRAMTPVDDRLDLPLLRPGTPATTADSPASSSVSPSGPP